jgi:AcrR family transcriptional regulator
VDDICLAAGISKGGFYHHFPCKESVFLETALEELAQGLKTPGPTIPHISDGREVNVLLVDLWAWVARHPAARRRVRGLHHRALIRLLADQAEAEDKAAPTGDRVAQATLRLVMGIGLIVRRTVAYPPAVGLRQRGRAAAS